MELKPGYKQTEVGVIPEDWSVVPLGRLYKFSNGVNADKAAYGKGLRFINVLEPISYSHIRGPEIPGLVEIPSQLAAAYTVNRGDIVFNRTSETDTELGMAAVYLGDEKVVFGGFVIRGQAISSVLDAVYAGYALRGETVRAQIIPLGQGAVRANIGQESLRKVLVPVPPKHEQCLIAEALQDIDVLLSNIQSSLCKKHQIKQAAVQELLTGKRRLQGFEGEWEVKRLGEIATISMGRTPSRSKQEYWGPGHTWLSIADLKSKIVTESKEEITDSAASTMSIIPKGTLLMSFKLSIGRLCFAGRDLFTNEAICNFNALDASGEFLYYVLGRTDFSLYGKQAVKGYTLNKESLQTVEVLLPVQEEQDDIASVLSSIDDEILILEERREKALSIKKGMMQQLLTGKIRLT